MTTSIQGQFAQSKPSARYSRIVCAGLLAAPVICCAAAQAGAQTWPMPQGAPAGKIAFFLVDPASSGSGLLGRGTFTYNGQVYNFEAKGARLSRTSADTPASLSGAIYNVKSLADLSGQYVSVGDRSEGLHYIRNEKGVVAELGTGVGSGKLQYRDATNPITITLINPAP